MLALANANYGVHGDYTFLGGQRRLGRLWSGQERQSWEVETAFAYARLALHGPPFLFRLGNARKVATSAGNIFPVGNMTSKGEGLHAAAVEKIQR